MTQTRIYHPKGSMCANCRWANRDCSDLKFEEMFVIGQYSKENEPITFKIVRCEEHETN